jgi:PII-like signaling protein
MSDATPKRDWKAHSLEGVCLRFIVHENRKAHGNLMHDWLLMKAKQLGIHGGSAFHGIAGFGRHGVLHEQQFWELAGDLPVEIRFVCSEDEAYRLLDLVEAEKLSVFYAITLARYGVAGADKASWGQGMPAP